MQKSSLNSDTNCVAKLYYFISNYIIYIYISDSVDYNMQVNRQDNAREELYYICAQVKQVEMTPAAFAGLMCSEAGFGAHPDLLQQGFVQGLCRKAQFSVRSLST